MGRLALGRRDGQSILAMQLLEDDGCEEEEDQPPRHQLLAASLPFDFQVCWCFEMGGAFVF